VARQPGASAWALQSGAVQQRVHGRGHLATKEGVGGFTGEQVHDGVSGSRWGAGTSTGNAMSPPAPRARLLLLP
jgi:hypothetical protein